MENSSPQIDPARLPELYEAICQLHASLELNEATDRTLNAMIKLTGAERAFVKLHGRYSLYAIPKLEWTTERLIETPFEDLIHNLVHAQEGHPIADTLLAPYFSIEPLASLFASRVVSVIPLRTPNRFLGILLVDKAAGVFTANELAVLEALAQQGAIAIHAARSYRTNAALVSALTHELYRPLTGLNGYFNLTLQEVAGPLNDSQKQFLREVYKDTARISQLVNGFSTLARLESGRMVLNSTALDLAVCVKDCLTDPSLTSAERKLMEVGLRPEDIPLHFSKLSQLKQQTLNLHLSDLPLVRTNRDRLVDVINLLLDNAVKYTPVHGEINITAEAQKTTVRLSVQDTGGGIPVDEQPRLFTQWFRSLQSPAHEIPGLGLSLYIAKQYIELMDGAIGFESEPGKGSTFWFTLPIAEE